jgi:hypothetical protein
LVVESTVNPVVGRANVAIRAEASVQVNALRNKFMERWAPARTHTL